MDASKTFHHIQTTGPDASQHSISCKISRHIQTSRPHPGLLDLNLCFAALWVICKYKRLWFVSTTKAVLWTWLPEVFAWLSVGIFSRHVTWYHKSYNQWDMAATSWDFNLWGDCKQNWIVLSHLRGSPKNLADSKWQAYGRCLQAIYLYPVVWFCMTTRITTWRLFRVQQSEQDYS